jgi:hypothetical protein
LRQPFQGDGVKEMVSGRFAHKADGCGGFQVEEIPVQKRERGSVCSPLLEADLTTLDSRSRARFFEWDRELCKYERPLPNALLWANRKGKEEERGREEHWETTVFAKVNEGGTPSVNDLLVRGCDPGSSEANAVSQMLCELLAARRSMLFGLALADKFVNVTLPYAILTSAPERDPKCGNPKPAGSWILQPVVSLIRIKRDGSDFRRMYCLSFFLVPFTGPCFEARAMRKREIETMVNAGWGLSTCPPNLSRFDVSGPLPCYATRLEPLVEQVLHPDEPDSGAAASQEEGEEVTWQGLTLRKATEAITYAVARRMALAPASTGDDRVRREIGDEVVSALGNSRVSAVTVIDPEFVTEDELDDPNPEKALPGALGELMPTLARRVRIPLGEQVGDSHHYRLDRPYIDHHDYAL